MSQTAGTAAAPTATTTAPALGSWSLLRSPAAAATAAAAGVDWICLDAQHGEHDDASVREVCTLLAGSGVPVHVRPPANDAAWIGRALDAGAAGVVVPLVEDAGEAAAAVAACRYPPHGRRSWGPLGGAYGRAVPSAREARARCAVMVETAGALERVEAIAAVDGLDEVFVGPFDLSLSLGRDVEELVADPAPDAPLRRVVAACRRAGVVAGAFGVAPGHTRALLALGFTSVAYASDVSALGEGLARLRPGAAAG
ncbi:aldolase [Kineococcus sp. T13]|uniref:aldolase/citrate lyase family protein n=1 Tax=Kineococcus vitellinus TaxID=2696565 RepID=UPI001412FCF1|nr:aldolase [Kineococcus vitellinus]